MNRIFPSGFTGLRKADAPPTMTGDAEVTKLYLQYEKRPELINSFSFLKNVYNSAVRLIGTDYHQFLQLNAKSDTLTPMQHELLYDYTKGLISGSMSMTIQTYAYLIAEERGRGLRKMLTPAQQRVLLRLVPGYPRQWLAKATRMQRGDATLLMFLYLVFGIKE